MFTVFTFSSHPQPFYGHLHSQIEMSSSSLQSPFVALHYKKLKQGSPILSSAQIQGVFFIKRQEHTPKQRAISNHNEAITSLEVRKGGKMAICHNEFLNMLLDNHHMCHQIPFATYLKPPTRLCQNFRIAHHITHILCSCCKKDGSRGALCF